jgi:hypothetical protein
MHIHVEMRSADTDVDVYELVGPVRVQLRAPYVQPPKRELWQQKGTASNAHFDRVIVTNGFDHECSECRVCDGLWFMTDFTKVTSKHLDVLWQHNKKKQTPWPLVRKRTMPTERPPLVDEI